MKRKKEDVKVGDCPFCHHDRIWGSRGIIGVYVYKCCKCKKRWK